MSGEAATWKLIALGFRALGWGAGWAVNRLQRQEADRKGAAPTRERGRNPDGSYGVRSAGRPPQPEAPSAGASRATGSTANPSRTAPVVDPLLPGMGLADLLQDGAYVCVDSNIWLDQRFWPALEAMITSLAASETPLVMAGEQLEEIDRLRSSEDRELASIASRVNRLISEACKRRGLIVREVRDSTGSRDFDSYLVREVRGHLKVRRSAARVVVVTEDVKLTTRLHSQAAALKRDPSAVVVLTGSQFAKWIG